jgi:tetratricopeptide (TPR) repeat protein
LKRIWENKQEVDSIRFHALEVYYDTYNQVRPDSTLQALDYHYRLAQEKNDNRELYFAAKRKGNIHRLKGNYEVAMDSYKEAEKLAIDLNDATLQAAIMGNLGNVFIYQQDYQKATRYFSTALKVYQETNDTEGQSHMVTSLGSVYLIIQNYDLALEYYKKALAMLNQRGFEDRRTAVIYINIGWTNFEKGLYPEAKNDYEKALGILQVKNEKFFITNCYSTLAKIHLELGQLDEAYAYATKNLVLNQELGLESGVVEAEITIAQIDFETNIDIASEKGQAILAHLPPSTSKETKRDLYELLYKCFKARKKLEQSLAMLELYTLYHDSIQTEKNNYAVAREAVKNDFDIQLYETKLESEKEKARLELVQFKKTIGIVSVSIILIAGLLFLYISNNRKNKQRRNLLLEEINSLKANKSTELVVDSKKFELSREKIEVFIQRKLNDTDWKVLNLLLDDPVITNQEIAEKAFMSVDGIGSSLRRMYEYFEIKESKYKKISLLLEAIKISNNT